MNLNREKLMRIAERFLHRTEEYRENKAEGKTGEDNFQLHHVLVKGPLSDPENIHACAIQDDCCLFFHPFKPEYTACYSDDMIDLEDEVFGDLEKGYEIVGMSEAAHYNVWCMVEERGRDGIEHQAGMQKYLEYCRRNNITKQFLDEDAPVPVKDIMQVYQREPKNKQKPRER